MELFKIEIIFEKVNGWKVPPIHLEKSPWSKFIIYLIYTKITIF